MIEFTKLIGYNFAPYKYLELSLTNKGIVAVENINKDTTRGSNRNTIVTIETKIDKLKKIITFNTKKKN